MKNITTIIIAFCVAIGTVFAANTNQELTSLKAVLIVGPQEDGTSEAIKKMDRIANFLKSKAVTVHTFYDSKSVWSNIVTASNGAHFFIYSGHGSTLGGGGKVGGLCLASSNMISSEKMVAELKLAKNAMVLFSSVCGGAGSSADDTKDIGIEEASTRVTDYARPFFKTGAGAYYANNMSDGCLKFLRDFFDGKTIKECFTNSASTWSSIEKTAQSSIGTGLEISVASNNWGGTSTVTTYVNGVKSEKQVPSIKEYDIAYVAPPTFTIKTMSSGK